MVLGIDSKYQWSPPHETLPPDHNNKWYIWKSLNRFRTKVEHYKVNLKRDRGYYVF